MIPDPFKEWFSDKTKQTRLATLLADPIMKEAMTLLQTIKLPADEHGILPSAEEIGRAALDHHRNRGFFAYPKELWQLTEAPEKPPVLPEPYSANYVLEYAKKTGWFQGLPDTPETPEPPTQP